MQEKKNIPINYYSRDFQSIKQSLVEHAKRYYPDSFKDFSEAGFGSLMLDTVSYIGDVMSFYMDYQVNESFLDTASEVKNVIKLAKQMGYKHNSVPTSYGTVALFITVPSLPNGLGSDPAYIPKLKRRSEFSSGNGNKFTLLSDVDFSNPTNEIVVAANDEITNIPTYWAIKAYGVVISGYYDTIYYDIGEFTKFLKIKLPRKDIAEVVKVEDSEGNEYYEVENLSQDIVYVPIANKTANSAEEPLSLLRPYTTPRRYVLERDEIYTYLQFGSGTSAANANSQQLTDPSKTILKRHAKKYISDTSFDPNKLVNTEKLGIVPVNTTLGITVRANNAVDINIAADELNSVDSPLFEFEEENYLNTDLLAFVVDSLEITNEEKIVGDVPRNTSQEIKIRAKNSLSAQNRAVTIQDYKTLVYNMPNEFGSIKRVNIIRDENSYKRNLNMYVVSEDEEGSLTETQQIIKENIKIWLNENRMINDTIDILDAKILNLGINYTIVNDYRYEKSEVLSSCAQKLEELFSHTREIGEPFFISDIQRVLKNVSGVLDVVDIQIENKYGSPYSQLQINLDTIRSADGRYLEIPKNVIFEIKYPETDIKGAVV